MPWIYPLLALAAGSYITYSAQAKAKKKSREAAAYGRQRQQEETDKNSDRVVDFAKETYDVEKRDVRRVNQEEKYVSDQIGRVTDYLDTNKDSAATAGTTQSFDVYQRKANLEQLERASDMAMKMSKVRGDQKMRQDEGFGEAQQTVLANRSRDTRRAKSRTDQILTQLAAEPDGGRMMIGGILSSLGMAGLSGAAMGGTLFGTTTAAPGLTGAGMTLPKLQGIQSTLDPGKYLI